MVKPLGLEIINGNAYLNNHSLKDLKNKYGSPLYILDETTLDYSFNEYINYFKGDNFNSYIVYASKALLLPKLLEYCTKYNTYVDSVSLGDLYIIKESNFDMKKVIFHGNNKSIEELKYAVENNVGIIVVDNIHELKELIKLNKTQNIMIRINPGIDAHTHKYITTGTFTSKFGIPIYDINTIEEMINLIKNSCLTLLGFHAHIGSSIMDESPFIKEIDVLIDFQNEINKKYNLCLNHLNLGGGFGVDYIEEDKSISIKDMSNKLSKKLDEKIKETSSLINNVYIEPGRSIVGTAGITLYNISMVKMLENKNYLFIEGGMADNIRPALYEAIYSVDVAEKMNEKPTLQCDIVGKCCESGDIIRKGAIIPQPDENDTLIVYTTGAYNYSMSSNYNSMLKPAVLIVGKDISVASRKEELKDLMRLFTA